MSRNRTNTRAGRARPAHPTQALALGALLFPAAAATAQGLPVASGTSDCAALTYSDHRLVVTQGLPNCVIDWATFDISADSTVEFMQPGSWRLMNNVSAEAFSTIAGTLRADGTIYIVNPAGVFFTGSAVVDVGGIYAAGAALDPDEFRAGVDRFVTPSGAIVNDGSIEGRMVHLIGSQIANHGTIVSDGGVVTMVAGAQEVMLSDDGGRVSVRVDGVDLTTDLTVSPGGVPPTLTGPVGVENTGTVEAVGGQVTLGVGDVYALAIRNSGRLSAPGGTAQLAALGGTVVHGGADAALEAAALAVTGDALYLEANVNADAVRFNDPVLIGTDVRIEGAAPDTDADEVVFTSTVDSHETAHGLDVDAAHTTFGDTVGGATRLASVDVSGNAAIARDVLVTEAIRLGGDATFTEDGAQVLDAGAGAITAGGTLLKTTSNSLTLRAGHRIDLAGDVEVERGRLLLETAFVDAEGSLTSGNGEVRINGAADVEGSLSAGTGVVVTGAARVGGNVTALEDVRFFDTAAIGGAVSAGQDTRFAGNATVGGDVIAGLDVEFFADATVGGNVSAGDKAFVNGVALIDGDVTAVRDAEFFSTAVIGGSVAAGDDAYFAGPTTIGGSVSAFDNTIFEASANVGGDVFAGGDAEFFADAVVAGTVTAGDDAEFFGTADVGSVVTSDDARFHGVTIVRDAVHAGGDVSFDRSARVGGDVSAGDDITFLADGFVGGSATAVDDLEVLGAAFIGGNVATGDDTRFMASAQVGGRVDAGGDATFAGAAVVGGSIVAGDDAIFSGPSTLGGDVLATDRITFNDTVTLDGARDQRIAAGGTLRANDAVIKTTAGALSLSSGDVLTLNGALVQALGDIHLGPAGRSSVPAVATISSNGDISIVSLTGDVVMGVNEKLTILGTLRLSAAGQLVLGDITTLDDMIVTAPSIRVRPRAAGLVLDDDGVFTLDAGVDFVAGGRFLFSSAPQLLGEMRGNLLFASSRADADPFGTLSAFRPRVFGQLRRSLLRRQGQILDVRADGAPISELAIAFAADPSRPGVAPPPRAAALAPTAAAALQALGLRLRPPTAVERAASRIGPVVYHNLRATGEPPADEGAVAVDRLDATAVARGLRDYEALDSGAARAVLARAWAAYAESVDAPDGAGFRRYLESRPDPSPALACLDGIRDVLREVVRMGVTETELRAVADTIVAAVTPDEIAGDVLVTAIGAPPKG